MTASGQGVWPMIATRPSLSVCGDWCRALLQADRMAFGAPARAVRLGGQRRRRRLHHCARRDNGDLSNLLTACCAKLLRWLEIDRIETRAEPTASGR